MERPRAAAPAPAGGSVSRGLLSHDRAQRGNKRRALIMVVTQGGECERGRVPHGRPTAGRREAAAPNSFAGGWRGTKLASFWRCAGN